MFPIIYIYAVWFQFLCRVNAAFGVSTAFVPYRPNYDLVCEYLPKTTKGEYSVGTAYALVSGLPITFSKSGAYRISAYHSYSHAVPQGLIISRSNSDYASSLNILAQSETTSDVAVLSATVNVQTTSGTSYYIWVKAKTAGTNQIGVTIEYLG